MDSNMKKEKPK